MPKAQRDEWLHNHEETGWNLIANNTIQDEATDCFNDTTDEWGPTAEISVHYKSPMALFFYFMPKSMWRSIATETNRYERNTRSARVIEHEKKYGEDQHTAFLKKVDKFVPVSACEVSIWFKLHV
jgi:hypothetical protein